MASERVKTVGDEAGDGFPPAARHSPRPAFAAFFADKSWFILLVAALVIIVVCFARYLQNPSFWLDEALVAISLRSPSPQTIFSRLERGLYFPRVYLSCIAAARELFGYHFWSLRLLPFAAFVAATLMWARLLARRVAGFSSLALLGGALLIGSSFWLEQAVQLKQYSLDVLVALLPFAVNDRLFKSALGEGRNKLRLAGLAVPCFFSYTYPFALLARVIGWYVAAWGRKERRLNLPGVLCFVLSVALGLISIWATDYRHGANLTGYWSDCILRYQLHNGAKESLGLLANFLWGWYPGRLMPLAVAAVAPLQLLGFWSVARHWRGEGCWGSRSVGSITLLAGVIAASIIAGYPMCAGRLTLFAQIHTQILALEGALWFRQNYHQARLARLFIYASVGAMMLYSAHRFFRFAQSEPPENIRPLLAFIKPETADVVWVHPCSIAQVESLPEPLPAQKVLLNTRREYPPAGEKCWVLWTHMGDEYCVERLAEIRAAAKNWQVIAEGNGRALALAQF